jgi:TrmH family RNA methyltransferase
MGDGREALDRVVIVLWETQDIVNIAATIRAMKNFGLSRLRLVSPLQWDPWRIEGIAHDTEDLAAATEIHESLESALADCTLCVAMTARGRRVKRAVARPREIVGEILSHVAAPDSGLSALVFGREDTGLPNSALDLCHKTVTIPSDPKHPSMNLAQAVLVAAYELWMETGAGAREFKQPRRNAPPANTQLLEKMFSDVESALWTVDFFKNRQTESTMRTLRELAHRTQLDEREASFLRAISIEVVKHVNRMKDADYKMKNEE